MKQPFCLLHARVAAFQSALQSRQLHIHQYVQRLAAEDHSAHAGEQVLVIARRVQDAVHHDQAVAAASEGLRDTAGRGQPDGCSPLLRYRETQLSLVIGRC